MTSNPLRSINRKKARKKYIRINIFLSLPLILLASLALTYLCFRLQPTPIEDLWAIIVKSNYEIFRLNWIPILLIMLFLYALFNNTVIACGLTGGAAVLFSAVNRNMIYLRQDPFKPMDILLARDFLGIAKSIDHKLLMTAAAGAAVFLIFLALCLIFIRNKPVHPAIHLTAAAVIAVVCVWYNNAALSSKSIYDSLAMSGNIYNTTDNFESKGFVYSFLYTMNTSHITAPPAYDKDKAAIAQRIKDFVPTDLSGAAKPNIIMILSESFSDILLNPGLNFDNYTDPMKNYKRIRGESIGGHIVAPDVGGGTADTEFDIFTGLNSRHFRGTPYTYSLITQPVSALPSVLSGIGYYSLALHPGFGWFYNRQNVYPYMGFDTFYDIKSYDAKDTKGMYATETQTIDRIISEYGRHMLASPDTPLYEFCVTIQNHGPYPGKYNAKKNFDTDLPLSSESKDALCNYVEGMLDCDRELGVLADYLSTRPEPVILVYYGDHMPSFTTEVYNTLLPPDAPINSFDGLTRLYKTPFLIWRNRAAQEKGIVEKPASDGDWVISSNYLGVNLLHMLGFDGQSAFMDYVNDLSAQYPVILENHALLSDGSFIDYSIAADDQINFFRSWEYYWIFN